MIGGQRALVPREVERRCDAEEGVADDGDQQRIERELRRVHRVDVAEGVPDGPDAVLERVLEDQQEGRDEQRGEVAERDEPHAEADDPGFAQPSWRLDSRSMMPMMRSTPSEMASSSTARAVAPLVSKLSR